MNETAGGAAGGFQETKPWWTSQTMLVAAGQVIGGAIIGIIGLVQKSAEMQITGVGFISTGIAAWNGRAKATKMVSI